MKGVDCFVATLLAMTEWGGSAGKDCVVSFSVEACAQKHSLRFCRNDGESGVRASGPWRSGRRWQGRTGPFPGGGTGRMRSMQRLGVRQEGIRSHAKSSAQACNLPRIQRTLARKHL